RRTSAFLLPAGVRDTTVLLRIDDEDLDETGKDMKKWDGVIRDGHSIMFDGKQHYEIPPPEGGYGPYKVWKGGKSVAIIGRTQYELMHSREFWQDRHDEQVKYITQLAEMRFLWSGRMQQLLESAMEVMD